MSIYDRTPAERGWPVVKTVMDVAIYLDPETGSFHATIGNTNVARKDLKALEREITSRSSGSLQVMTDGYGADRMRVLEIVRVEGNRYRLRTGDLWEAYRTIYAHDPELISAFADLQQRREAASAAFDAETDRLKQRLVRLSQKDVMRDLAEQRVTPETDNDGPSV